ncbi:unnamed protein product, partial [Amoebophrya sp. A25]|eukprot:GSA25T00000330001.1
MIKEGFQETFSRTKKWMLETMHRTPKTSAWRKKGRTMRREKRGKNVSDKKSFMEVMISKMGRATTKMLVQMTGQTSFRSPATVSGGESHYDSFRLSDVRAAVVDYNRITKKKVPVWTSRGTFFEFEHVAESAS